MTTLNLTPSSRDNSFSPRASDVWSESEMKTSPQYRLPHVKDGLSFENGQDLITSLRLVYPNLFTSENGDKGVGKLDIDKVKAEIGKGNFVEKEEFGLKWDNKKVDRNLDLERKKNLVVFNHVLANSIGDGTSENLLIEGDNFDTLRYLSATHRGKVNCIYIDPPYNTGNRDFIYEDNYQDKTATFRHSKWLSFMNARLLLAKDILATDGVILVSIDDNEYHHLKMLMDQIFAGMYRGTIVWKRRSGANDSTGVNFSTNHEYILVYSGKKFSFEGEEKNFSNYSNPDDDKEGDWSPVDPSAASGTESYRYAITNPHTGQVYLPPTGRYWAFPEYRVKEWVMSGKLIFPTIKNKNFLLKKYKKHLRSNKKPISSWVIPSSEKDEKTVVDDEVSYLSWGGTSEGTKLVQKMLPNATFDYPKPLSLVKTLIEQSTQPGDLVLDFFGGSGTTGHAVMAINAENDTEEPRRFIVASSTESTEDDPNKNICRDVTAARLRAASQGYQFRKKTGFESIAGLSGNFSYMKASVIPLDEIVFELQAEQIWNALQLSFSKSYRPFIAKQPVQFSETSEGVIAYCEELHTEKSVKAIQSLAKTHGNVHVFFQKLSAEARNSLEGTANLQKIPQELLAMFGMNE